MTAGRAALALALLAFAAPTVAAPGPAGPAAPVDQSALQRGGDILVVDADGEGYDTVQAAVDAATDGDTVRVTPGTYRETVTVDENVTLVAPRGATLVGSGLDDSASAFEVDGAAAPTLDGFTVVDYGSGVRAASTAGDWTVRNTTFRAVGRGVGAIYSTGDWTVRNVTVVDAGGGILAAESTGDWLVADTLVRNVTEGRGVDASPTAGDWTLRNVTVTDVDFVGVAASYSTGDWLVVDATVRGALVGVGAVDASGNWTVRGSTLAATAASDRYDFWQPPLTEGAAVDASGANGSWAVQGTRFRDNDAAVVADGAETGDATSNYFGADGPDPDDCTGAVDCSAPLDAWPPASPVPTGTPSPTDARAGTGGSPTGPATGARTPSATASPPPTTVPPDSPTPTAGAAPLPVPLLALALAGAAALLARRR